MKGLLKTEEIILFAASLYLFHYYNFSWTRYLIFILLPDISMVGYLLNTKVGAYAYNLAHHKGIAAIVFFTGLLFQLPELQFAGLILFSHSSLDRILGYGLKYNDSFHHTHLGTIGKSS